MIVVSGYRTDPRHVTDGVPVQFGGLTLHLVSEFSASTKEHIAYQQKKYRQWLQGTISEIPADVQEQMSTERAAATIVGWDGAVDEQGKPVEFSKAAALELMRQEPFLRRDVLFLASQKETFRLQDAAALGKDSSPPLAPS